MATGIDANNIRLRDDSNNWVALANWKVNDIVKSSSDVAIGTLFNKIFQDYTFEWDNDNNQLIINNIPNQGAITIKDPSKNLALQKHATEPKIRLVMKQDNGTYTALPGLIGTTVQSDGYLETGKVYSGDKGIIVSGTTIQHTNNLTAGAVGPTATATGGSINIPHIEYDQQGHITTATAYTYTAPTYSAGNGITISNENVISHSNIVTAGTIGSTAATSGASIAIPYAKYDAQGHITTKGTHTHTISVMTSTQATDGTDTTDSLISAANLKAAIKEHSKGVYSGGTSITISGTTINHSDNVNLVNWFGEPTDNEAILKIGEVSTYNNTVGVTNVNFKYNKQGHFARIDSSSLSTMPTMTQTEAETGTEEQNKLINAVNLKAAIKEHSKGVYTGGTGITVSNAIINHTNSITAGTIGSTAATSGASIVIPYATYDAQGHITAKGTRTHTIPTITASAIAAGTSTTAGIISAATLKNALLYVGNSETEANNRGAQWWIDTSA